ncbi:hypothetical protein [Streptomyces plumbiresistens]|uniref:Lipoprotein n=1 Tax=Streptomyces plumbiresistens TaxID=511811 RepID=A0ABP7R2G0_9ACTN
MRGVGAAVVACVAAVVLTACGGGGSGDAAEEPEGSGGPAGVTVTLAAVRGDIRAAAAAGDFGRPRFVDDTGAPGAGRCSVFAEVRTHTKPDRKAVAALVAKLKGRGWHELMQTADPGGEGWTLEKESWSLIVLAGAMTKEQVAAAQPPGGAAGAEAFSGLYLSGLGRDCGAAAATPVP